MSFPYLRLRLTARPVGGAPNAIPDAKRVRRAFGRELIARFCPFGAPRCQDADPPGACPQLAMCPYAQVFARFAPAGHCARPPFALYTGTDRGTSFVEITFFDKAWPFYLWTVRTLEAALRKGIGGQPRCWQVLAMHRVHPDGQRSRLILGPQAPTPDIVPDSLPLAPAAGDADLLRDTRPIAVELQTPTRLVDQRRVLGAGDPVPFATLIARVHDRLRDLYGDEATAAIAARIGDRDPSAVSLLADHTRFASLHDWSTKKRTALPIGGKVGFLVYGAGAAAFLPLLRCAAITHVGKNPAAGLGRIRAGLLDCDIRRLPSVANTASARPIAADSKPLKAATMSAVLSCRATKH